MARVFSSVMITQLLSILAPRGQMDLARAVTLLTPGQVLQVEQRSLAPGPVGLLGLHTAQEGVRSASWGGTSGEVDVGRVARGQGGEVQHQNNIFGRIPRGIVGRPQIFVGRYRRHGPVTRRDETSQVVAVAGVREAKCKPFCHLCARVDSLLQFGDLRG